MSSHETKDLLARARMRDRDAITELVMHYQRAVRGYVGRTSCDPLTADDIAQEVFLAAIDNVDRIDPEVGVLPYLLGIARNMVRAEWRKRFRENEVSALALEQMDGRASRGASSAGDERLWALRDCVDRLAPKTKDVVRKHYTEELRCDEIARELSVAASSVRSILTRARRQLRQCVESKLQEATP